jgi:hypothetical protein
VIQSFTFIAIGVLVYLSADWFRRLLSYRTDTGERDGVIRYGGLSRKIWKEDDAQKFASRIDNDRFAAAVTRWFMKIFGAVFVISGIVQLIGLLVK